MENYKPRKYIIMLMIDVLVVDDDDDDDDDVVVVSGAVGALLSYVKFAEFLQTQFLKNAQILEKNERANPICLMNHFSVFNTNYGRSFSCSRRKNVCMCTANAYGSVYDCRLFHLFHLATKPFMWNRKKFEHATVLYTLCVYHGNHTLISLQRNAV